MNIKLSNGTTLSPILITGEKRNVQGAIRDTLTFVFPASTGLETLDEAFNENACSIITVEDEDGNEYIHKGYILRCELKKESIEITPATGETEAVMEDRVFVSMSQKTYIENKIESFNELLENYENRLLLLESGATEDGE